jgi:prolipoprotein diacylglyceryltransferase
VHIFLALCAVAVLAGVAYGTYRFWLEGTQGEVGPALVGTVLSLIVIGFCLYFAIDAQDGDDVRPVTPSSRDSSE